MQVEGIFRTRYRGDSPLRPSLDQLAGEKAGTSGPRPPRPGRISEFQKTRRPRAQRNVANTLPWKRYARCCPCWTILQRSLKAESADKEYVKGMELIYQRFYEGLKKLGLEPIVSTGQPFDPHVHHAVDMVKTDEAPADTVLEEFQRGYNFKGRMLRPAMMVKVAVQPQAKNRTVLPRRT